MPKKVGFFNGGFIDILSLVAVVFLVATIITGTLAVNNKNANYNIQEKAACMDPCTLDTDCAGGEYCYRPATGCSICKVKTTTPVTYTCTQTSGQYCSRDCSYSSGSGTCQSGYVCCKQAPAPTQSPTTPTPTPTPQCSANQIKCTGSGQLYSCVSGKWITDIRCTSQTCNSAGTNCGTPAPTKSPSPTPVPTYTCTQKSGQYCSTDCSYSPGSGTCQSGRVCCKTAPPSPTPNPNVQCSAGQIKCEGSGQLYSCYLGSWILDVKCATANCNPTNTACGTSTSNIIPPTYTCTQTSGQYCNKDCPYDLGSGTCQSGQVCCKTVDPNLACSTQGQVKCLSGQLYNCSSGYWYPGANCESKSCNATGTACIPLASCVATNGLGATRCKTTSTASYVETCSSSGTWTLGIACTGSCSNGLCSDCATKPNVCNNTGGINYCLNGTYYSKPCVTGTVCSGGTCIPADCATKPNVCNDTGGVNYCLNGSYTSIKCDAGKTCTGGECLSCNTRDMCLGVGQTCCPGLDKVRGTGCSSGLKCGSCLAGQTRCGGSGTSAYSETCQADDTWTKSLPCQYGCSELNGKCSAPPQKAVGQQCSSGAECLSGNCYALSQMAGGNPFDNQPTCHAQSVQTMDTMTKNVNGGVALTGAVVLTAAVTPEIAAAAYAYASVYGTAALATLPAALVNALGTVTSLAILAQGPLAVYTCETYGAESPQCQNYVMGITSGFFTDPLGTYESLQFSGKTLTGQNFIKTFNTDLATVTINPYTGMVTKNPLIGVPGENTWLYDAAGQLITDQAEFYNLYGGQFGIPQYYGTTRQGGYMMELVPGVPIKSFTGTLTEAEIQQAVNSLSDIQNLTGLPHGDIFHDSIVNTGNMIVGTNANGSNVVRFIDLSPNEINSFNMSIYSHPYMSPEAYKAWELQKLQQFLSTFKK